MTMRFWIRNLFARPIIRPNLKVPHRLCPTLELLEDRWLPSTFVVNNSTDSPVAGETDLRQAIASANATTGDNTITFDPTVFAMPQTITLAGDQLEASNTSGTETIAGPTADVTVNAGGLSRVFQVDANVTASISGLTITGGDAGSANGGGVNNYGSLTLANCTVSGNTVSGNSSLGGGGLYNKSSLEMTQCTVSGNTAPGTGTNGGGVFNYGGFYSTQFATLVMDNCTVSGNSAASGGGVYNFGYRNAMATFTDCIVSGNTVSNAFGGGVGNIFRKRLGCPTAP